MLTTHDLAHGTPNAVVADGARRRPYAGPAGVPVMGTSVPHGPYRAGQPAGARRAVEAGPTPTLPWIDQFLSSTPAAPVQAVASPVASAADEARAAESVSAPAADAWPLEEASARLAALRPTLARLDADAVRPDHLFAEPTPVDALPPWSDDDLIDIMPTLAASPEGAVGDEEAAARPVSPPRGEERVGGSSEVVALALEALALRVRRGELTLPGYDPALGDSAVLVAALAALHGVR